MLKKEIPGEEGRRHGMWTVNSYQSDSFAPSRTRDLQKHLANVRDCSFIEGSVKMLTDEVKKEVAAINARNPKTIPVTVTIEKDVSSVGDVKIIDVRLGGDEYKRIAIMVLQKSKVAIVDSLLFMDKYYGEGGQL